MSMTGRYEPTCSIPAQTSSAYSCLLPSRGLSGGEKRRLAIGAALVAAPGVLFLDEPTTGLDSATASRVVHILSALGRSGVTVVASMHQPSLHMFQATDKTLLLSSHGEMVYSGPTLAMESYFGALGHGLVLQGCASMHAVDYVLDTLTTVRARQLAPGLVGFCALGTSRVPYMCCCFCRTARYHGDCFGQCCDHSLI